MNQLKPPDEQCTSTSSALVRRDRVEEVLWPVVGTTKFEANETWLIDAFGPLIQCALD